MNQIQMSQNTLNQEEDFYNALFFPKRYEFTTMELPKSNKSLEINLDNPFYNDHQQLIASNHSQNNDLTNEPFLSAYTYNPRESDDRNLDYLPIETPFGNDIRAQGSQNRPKRSSDKDNKIDSTPTSSDKSNGKANANIVKNYIPITSNAFAHSIIESEHPEIHDLIYQSIREQCELGDFNNLRTSVLDYIKKKIFGKKSHTNQEKTNQSRQYKLRSKAQMSEVFHDSPKDNERTLLIKKILRNMMAKFIKSASYTHWVENEYAPKSIVNRQFLSDDYNREQIVNVYTCHKFRPAFK